MKSWNWSKKWPVNELALANELVNSLNQSFFQLLFHSPRNKKIRWMSGWSLMTTDRRIRLECFVNDSLYNSVRIVAIQSRQINVRYEVQQHVPLKFRIRNVKDHLPSSLVVRTGWRTYTIGERANPCTLFNKIFPFHLNKTDAQAAERGYLEEDIFRYLPYSPFWEMKQLFLWLGKHSLQCFLFLWLQIQKQWKTREKWEKASFWPEALKWRCTPFQI